MKTKDKENTQELRDVRYILRLRCGAISSWTYKQGALRTPSHPHPAQQSHMPAILFPAPAKCLAHAK